MTTRSRAPCTSCGRPFADVETLLPDPEHAGSAERKILKQLDRVRRRAGKVRDVDVHLKALRTLPRRLGVEARDELRDATSARRARNA